MHQQEKNVLGGGRVESQLIATSEYDLKAMNFAYFLEAGKSQENLQEI